MNKVNEKIPLISNEILSQYPIYNKLNNLKLKYQIEEKIKGKFVKITFKNEKKEENNNCYCVFNDDLLMTDDKITSNNSIEKSNNVFEYIYNKYRTQLEMVYKNYNNLELNVIIYGYIIGGVDFVVSSDNMNNEQLINNVKVNKFGAMNTDVIYTYDYELFITDIGVISQNNEQIISVVDLYNLCDTYELLTPPVLFRGSLNECILYARKNQNMDSIISKYLQINSSNENKDNNVSLGMILRLYDKYEITNKLLKTKINNSKKNKYTILSEKKEQMIPEYLYNIAEDYFNDIRLFKVIKQICNNNDFKALNKKPVDEFLRLNFTNLDYKQKMNNLIKNLNENQLQILLREYYNEIMNILILDNMFNKKYKLLNNNQKKEVENKCNEFAKKMILNKIFIK